MIKMTTGKITVKAVLKKTATAGFADLKVGDSIEISSNFEGHYMSSPQATVLNCQTGAEVTKYFSAISPVLRCFEWEEQIVTELELETNNRLESVLSGIKAKVNFNDLNVNADGLIDMLKTFDAEADLSEMESNGWQMDFWIPVKYKGSNFTIDGGGYYRTLEFYKEEE